MTKGIEVKQNGETVMILGGGKIDINKPNQSIHTVVWKYADGEVYSQQFEDENKATKFYDAICKLHVPHIEITKTTLRGVNYKLVDEPSRVLNVINDAWDKVRTI